MATPVPPSSNSPLRSVDRLDELLELICEERINDQELAELEGLVRSSPSGLVRYVDYIQLHGALYWDAAGHVSSEVAAQLASGKRAPNLGSSSDRLADEERSSTRLGDRRTAPGKTTVPVAAHGVTAHQPVRARWSRRRLVVLASCSVAVMAMVGALAVKTIQSRSGQNEFGTGPAIVASTDSRAEAAGARPNAPSLVENLTAVSNGETQFGGAAAGPGMRVSRGPVVLSGHGVDGGTGSTSATGNGYEAGQDRAAETPVLVTEIPLGKVSEHITARLRDGWQSAGIEPSPRVDDATWYRRVWLDLAGRIPAAGDVKQFLATKGDSKRESTVSALLENESYARHMGTVWTNLLVGRNEVAGADRKSLERFLRQSFASNRPWSETVTDLVAADGTEPAANFLLAHLNNDALPATAVTSKVFLGTQIQCSQCHNHPFNGAAQQTFWEMHSFFEGTQAVAVTKANSQTGEREHSSWSLRSEQTTGPTYFETRSGLMKAAYPRFNGHEVEVSANTNRRRELAKLMTDRDDRQFAKAYVNRMWLHFFGAAFTNPVDDMGPHNPASHPELLEELADAFIRSGYDGKLLAQWICNSDAYHLASAPGASNGSDEPLEGQSPLFSRVYVKPFSAEQLYDSLMVASAQPTSEPAELRLAEVPRQEWMSQFAVQMGNDENAEVNTFDGTIPQALSLMNGPLVERALESAMTNSILPLVNQKAPEAEVISKLCMATLSRLPTDRELAAMKKSVRETRRASRSGAKGVQATAEPYSDLLWALVNSNEFVINH